MTNEQIKEQSLRLVRKLADTVEDFIQAEGGRVHSTSVVLGLQSMAATFAKHVTETGRPPEQVYFGPRRDS